MGEMIREDPGYVEGAGVEPPLGSITFVSGNLPATHGRKRNYPHHLLPSKMVLEFMRTFGQESKQKPEFPSRRVAILRLRLIVEELFELIASMWRRDIVGIADALGDLVYVVIGMAHTYGIPFDEVFRTIHRSNMSKAGPDGKAILRADGKILKGEGYRPPDLKKVMGLWS